MHHKVGDRLIVSTYGRTEQVRIRNVYTYPDGSIAYGFYSDSAGRHLLQACTCQECKAQADESSRAGLIGDPKQGGLINI